MKHSYWCNQKKKKKKSLVYHLWPWLGWQKKDTYQLATFGANVVTIKFCCFDEIHTIGSN
jgi:hypothetical protein